MKKEKIKTVAVWVFVILICALYVKVALADPTGATINSNSTDTGPTITPGNLTNDRGTITTIVLQAMQQDQHWKGYVGNVTGALSLRDSNQETLYDWTNLASPSGEVYATRSSSLSFSSVQCAQAGTITTEETFNNMTGTDADSISNTFNETDHTAMTIAGTTVNSCPYASMYVSSTSQGQDSNDDFQEILVEDASANLMYVSQINDDTTGFNSNSYDFQMIVGESDVKTTPTTFYFYVELS